MIAIDKNRYISNHDLANKNTMWKSWFSKIGIDTTSNDLTISSGRMLIVDPVYLADIYNENGEKEQFLKQKGILLNDFGGDVGGPILRTEEGGIMVFLVFDRVDSEGRPIFNPDQFEIPDSEEILLDGLGCDSGSYIFLDYSRELCSHFRQELSDNANLYALIKVSNGTYRIGYEQWETDEKTPYEAWKRNLVAFPLK
jgi:hypothetical protein